MREGWRQIWSDLLDSLHNRSPGENQIGLEGSPDPEHEEPDTDKPEEKTEPHVFKSDPEDDPSTSAEPTVEPGRAQRRTFTVFVSIILLIGVIWVLSQSRFGADFLAPDPPAPDVVATFEGGRITLADIESHLDLLLPSGPGGIARSPQALLSIVEDLISEQLVLRWAAERRPESEETFKHAVKHINDELSLDAFTSQLHEESLPVAESDMRGYFEANKENFGGETYAQVRDEIRQLLVIEREPEFIANYVENLRANASITRNFELLDVPPPSSEDLERYYKANLDQFALPRRAVVDEIEIPISAFADGARQRASDLLLRIRGGDSFAEAAARVSGVKLFRNQEVAEGARSSDWDKNVFALSRGQLGSVFQAGDSFYVVRLNELKPERNQSLAEARSIVVTAVARRKEQEWFEANSNKTLFTLNGQRYSVAQFYTEYQELPSLGQGQYSEPGGLRKLADVLIERMLLVADTYNNLLDVKTRPLADETRLRLLRQMMDQEEVDDKIEITEAEVQEFYAENNQRMSRPPKVRIRYLRIGLGASEDENRRALDRIEEAYQKLVPGFFQDGAEFAEVAREYSEDPISAAGGGELPEWIGETDDLFTELAEHPLHEAALGLEPGEIAKPFEMSGSLYIVQVLERTEPEPLSVEEARPFIEEILTEKKHDALVVDLQQRLLTGANVVIYPTVLEAYIRDEPTE